MIVAHSNMVMQSRVADSSRLLVSWIGAEGGGSRLDFVGAVWLSVVVFWKPDFAGSNAGLFSDAEFMELVVVTACQERGLLWNDLETPAFTVVVGYVHDGLIGSLDTNGDDSAIVMPNKNFSIEIVD